jgi:hypothetical protein
MERLEVDTPETESNQETSLKDRLAGLLKAEHGADFTYEAPTEEPEGQTEEAPTEEASPPAETESPEPTTEPEGQPEAETVEFETDGKQYKVPKELEPYLLRDKDYRHKTMELAEERKTVEALKTNYSAAFKVATELPQYAAAIQMVDAQLAQYQQVNMQQLKETDWIAYSNAQHDIRNLQDQKNSLVNQFQNAAVTLSKAETEAKQAKVARSMPLVRKAIPNWGAETAQALAKYAQDNGYEARELDNLVDHRDVLILHKAYLYDQLQAKRPETAKTVAAAPPVNKSTGPKVSANDVELKKAMARLQKTGDPEDAVAVMRLRRK